MNILNGDSAAATFLQAFGTAKENILVFRDVLSCGPLAPYKDMQQWKVFRVNFWQDILLENGLDPSIDVHDSPNDLYSNIDKLKTANNITLWIGCALSDHLLMVFIVKLFQIYELDLNKLSIHQYEKFGNAKVTVTGLGLLNPDETLALKPEPYALEKEQTQYCLHVWDAVIDKAPAKLIRILEEKTPCLPLLQKALWNLFYRYPDISTGLSRFDEIILDGANRHSPKAARIIGHSLAFDMMYERNSLYELDLVGDLYLFHRLKKMAQPHLARPLLKLNTLDKPLKETQVEVTEFGKEVLKGKHNIVQINGINDWVCGVHLNSENGQIWMRDKAHLFMSPIENSIP